MAGPSGRDLAPQICCSGIQAAGSSERTSSAKGETSQLLDARAAELLSYPQTLSQKLQDPTRVSTSQSAVEGRGGSSPEPQHWALRSCSRTIPGDRQPASASLSGLGFGIFLLQFSPLLSLSLSPSGLFLSFAGAQEFS